MKIAFLENHLNIRGTSVALYDYAHYNETILNNKSIIITRPYSMFRGRPEICETIYKKFEDRFPTYYYLSNNDIQNIIDKEKPDWLYIIKGGSKDDGLNGFRNVKLFIHCVFWTNSFHGDIYSPISESVNMHFNTSYPVLPHIVSLPDSDEHLRDNLGIPKNATVFGRYGGYDEFNIRDAQLAIDRITSENNNIYFLFMNTKPFCSNRKNIIHIGKSTDTLFKTKFINTCDAMIWARSLGESFGLSIGEFSSKNKPIFATVNNKMEDNMHKLILKDNAYWYTNSEDLYQMMKKFDKTESKTKDWNMYKEYTPEKVMNIFKTLIEK